MTEAPGRLERYEQRTAVPMVALALVFLAAYAVPVVLPAVPSWLRTALGVVNVVLWAAFGVDYVVHVALARHRVRWVLTHPIDLAIVVLPMLRPLRVLRLFSLTTAVVRRSGTALFYRAGQFVGFAATLLVLVGAVAVLDAERGAPDANIRSFGDALWWAATTITTVGYGDEYPTTGQGRLVGVALMLVGISLVGVVTASVAAWFVRLVGEENDEVAALRHEIRGLREALEARGDLAPARRETV